MKLTGWLARLALGGLCLAQGTGGLSWAQDDEAALREARAREDLRAESPLAVEPKTPRELIEAANQLVDLGRIDLARRYLELLPTASLSEADLLDLRDALGAAPLLRLEQEPELEALIRPLVDRTEQALLTRAADPAFIAEKLRALRGSDSERSTALAELRAMGPEAIPTLIAAIASPEGEKLTADASELLVATGRRAVQPLLAALESKEPRMQVAACDVLGRLRAREAADDLYYHAFGPASSPPLRDAARQALALVERRPRGPAGEIADVPVTTDDVVSRLISASAQWRKIPIAVSDPLEDLGPAWIWNEETGTVEPRQGTLGELGLWNGLRHASRALQLAPGNFAAQELDTFHRLGLAVNGTNWLTLDPADAKSVLGQARARGPAVLNAVLDEALKNKRLLTATAAARLLGDLGEIAGLAPLGREPAPLLRALDAGDTRLQYAAAEAISRLKVGQPFQGSPRVVEILRQTALAGGGRPYAIVGEVSPDRATDVAGMLRELGFDVLAAPSGREAFRAAATRSDIALAVLHPNIIRWALSETVANFQADPRTQRIPVVVYGPARLAGKFRNRAEGQPPVAYATYVSNSDDLAKQIPEVLAQVRGSVPTPEQGLQMRRTALDRLAALAANPSPVYDLGEIEQALAAGLNDPAVSESALQALSRVGTRRAQNVLAEAILNGTDDQLNENLRQALSAHIREYGLLLRRGVTEELRAQAQQSVIRNPRGNPPGTQPKTNPPAPSADTEPTSTESEPAAEETEQE
jgi:HEAT repeat protein